MSISSIGNSPEFPQEKGQKAVSNDKNEKQQSIYNAIEDFQVTKEESEQLGLTRTYDLTKKEDIQAFEKDTNSIVSDKLEELKAKRKQIENNKKHVEKLLQDKQKLANDLMELMQSFSEFNSEFSGKYGHDIVGMDKDSFEKMVARFFNSKSGSIIDSDDYGLAKVKAETDFSIDAQGRIKAFCNKMNITLNGYGSIEVTPFGVKFTDNQGKEEYIKKPIEEEKPKPGFYFADDSHNIPLFEEFEKPSIDNLKN